MDIAVANSSDGAVSIFLADGLGGFLPSTKIVDVGAYLAALSVGDYNGDGRPDVAAANQIGNSISILFGFGTGLFALAVNVTYGCSLNAIYAGDFNGDMKPDLAIVSLNDNNASISLNQAR
ncbi:MAG: VCBS repeat-containing protein [Myxococcales bacterium]|nr:VCBS repeat-containing protein [Myxococcales bacterium]